MATLPEIGAKATNGSNAIPEAGSSWPSWPRASDIPSAAVSSPTREGMLQEFLARKKLHRPPRTNIAPQA